jgi:hypothetical protein
MEQPQIYNKTEFAKTLGVSVECVDKYRKAGKLPFHAVGKRIIFTGQDLTDFLSLCAIPAINAPTEREKTSINKSYEGGLK